MKATMEPGKDLGKAFFGRVHALPGGEKILQCLQCGTCSASCPSSHAMDFSPRRIVAAFRAGRLDEVLASSSMWLCVSCYSCTVRCPAGIPFTDLMYELKRLGAELRLDGRKEKGAAMARAFTAVLDRRGRSSEVELLRRFYLSTNPLEALKQFPLGWRLLRKGRLKLRGKSIKGLKELRAMMRAVENGGSR